MADPFSSGFVRSIDANRTIKDQLATAVRGQSGRRRISATDLVNPRQAFFRWTRPDIQPSPDRTQTMMAGTGFHNVFGQAVSSEEFVEQFMEFEGIVGKIDIYEDIPVELKTTSSILEGTSAARPAYIDQLGIYCVMTGIPMGRLLVYRRQVYDRSPELRAFSLEFGDLDGIRAEMVRRRDLFRQALDRDDPGALPRCDWFDRGCDYQGICGCESADPLIRMVPAAAVKIERDQAVEGTLARQLPVSEQRPERFRFNDLVFPRKAAYERLKPEEEEEEDETLEARLKELERKGFRGTLYKALRFGVPGAFKNLPVKLRSLTERVGIYKGTPTLLRFTKFRKIVDRDRLPYEMGHYFDRLGFECALVNSERGRLVLYYETLPDEKFMVYDVTFRDLPAIFAEADRRLALLEADAPPGELPACPAWMFKRCEFAPQCGCGSESTQGILL